MDTVSAPLESPLAPRAPWKPDRCDRVALMLQGGGALGAYQGGVYEGLHEAGLEPDWICGVSIGALNGAIIAGNKREDRVPRLREFWERITSRPDFLAFFDGDEARKWRNAASAMGSMMFGQPGFFRPHYPNAWFAPRGGSTATSFYDASPLAKTLSELVDFSLIGQNGIRFAVGAVNVANGNFAYFDNADGELGAEHVMASGALPPGLPMVQIGTDYYWDGGLVSNTPLSHLLDHAGQQNMLVFQVDLFSALGPIPRDMPDVLGRAKDIQYSSRTRLVTDMYRALHKKNLQLRDALAKIPVDMLDDEQRALKADLADPPEIAILHMIYQQAAYEGHAKDYEFSASSMREHWEAGLRDTRRTLQHQEWLEMPVQDEGIVVHDVHRVDS